MAATLPPIKTPVGGRQGQNMQQFNMPVPSPPKGPPSGKLKPLRKVGKADREILFKQEVLRQQQPDLSKKQTTRYVTHSYVSQATHAFLGMLPLCFCKIDGTIIEILLHEHHKSSWYLYSFKFSNFNPLCIYYLKIMYLLPFPL